MVSTVSISPDPTYWYGISFPQVSQFAPADDPIYTLITSINPFRAAWSGQYPASDEFPVAFGYNTLLLTNTSAVVLDTPVKDNVTSMQKLMIGSESWSVSADVKAYMALYNPSSPTFRDDDTFWSVVFDQQFVDMNMYEGNTRVGMVHSDDNSQVAFGLYNATDDTSYPDLHYIDDTQDPDIVAFRQNASIYDISRVQCHGTWYINKTSISLLGGSCDISINISQDVVTWINYSPYRMDTLPIFGHLFRTAAATANWPWLNATYAVSMATAYWARAAYMLNPDAGGVIGTNDDLYYKAQSETITSSRSTLKASGYLYLVLAIQPFLTVVALLLSISLRDVPIGRGFGVTALLSGFEASGSQLIDGAALSGELRKPVRLEIIPVLPDQDMDALDDQGNCDARVKYRLTSSFRPIDGTKLQRDRTYG